MIFMLYTHHAHDFIIEPFTRHFTSPQDAFYSVEVLANFKIVILLLSCSISIIVILCEY